MGFVETVMGPVDASTLGVTLMHEHVFVRCPEVASNWPVDWDPEARVAQAVERLTELAEAGVGTIVDLTVVGLGRDMALVRRVGEKVPIHIVASTGIYTYDSLPHFFDYRGAAMRPNGVDVLDEFFRFDIEQGIKGTPVKAGMLKVATDEQGVTPGVERALRAVARVHRATGVPISTHTHAQTRRGLEQQRIFAEEGVDLSRVVIGHCGDTTDIEYLEELMKAGSTIGMDRFGIDVYLPTEQRVETVVELCKRGWANQIVLSHDASCHIDWLDDDLRMTVQPNWNYLHISRDVLPMLRDRGVSEDQITQMLVVNPRRILDHGPGY